MSIGRSQSVSRRGFDALCAAALLAVSSCSGDAADEPVSPPAAEAPAPPPPPALTPAAPPSASGNVEEPSPTPPSASEGPVAPPPLDPGAAAGPSAPPSSTPPSSTPPPSEPPPAERAPAEPPVPEAPSLPGDASCAPAEGSAALRLTEIVTGLVEPVFVTAAPGDATRLYVLERTGAIRVVRDGQLLPEPFLDLRARVATANEEGLVGLAFHPEFQENGRFFIQYALLDPARGEDDDEQIVLSELARSAADPDRADPASERTLMIVEQPANIHLGGMLAFGPRDGMLYVGRGDGGTNNGPQDTERLFGKILRIDVDTRTGDLPYGIPEGNMGSDGILPEIWNMGLRNPWRFSFDSCTGDLYIGDVGENTSEEIDVEPAATPGRNYGWKTVEGLACFEADTCDTSSFTTPTLSYGRDFGCAVTGGYVYRGQRIPGLRGTYLYADFCTGNVGSFRFEGGLAAAAADITADLNPTGISLITSFGVDNAGELYVVSQLGSVYRIDPE
jgi:glucose/arabinose dehydrogenase